MIYLNPKDRNRDNKKEVNTSYDIDELKLMAKEKGIKGYGNMKLEKLIERLGLK